jgi:hypothetical protein
MVKKSNVSQGKVGTKKHAKYSAEKLNKDLGKVRNVHATLGRGRFAIYGYWNAVYRLRRKWGRLRKNTGVKIKPIAERAVIGGVPASSGDDLLRLILDQTMTTAAQSPMAAKKLSKLKSKYFSLLNFAFSQKVTTRDLEEFIKKHGGLNFSPSVRSSSSAKKKTK